MIKVFGTGREMALASQVVVYFANAVSGNVKTIKPIAGRYAFKKCERSPTPQPKSSVFPRTSQEGPFSDNAPCMRRNMLSPLPRPQLCDQGPAHNRSANRSNCMLMLTSLAQKPTWEIIAGFPLPKIPSDARRSRLRIDNCRPQATLLICSVRPFPPLEQVARFLKHIATVSPNSRMRAS